MAFFTTRDQAQIFFTDAGRGAPVVLIHGFGGSIDYWRAQATALEGAGYRVLALGE